MKSKRAWYPSTDPIDYELEEEQQIEITTYPSREAGAAVTVAYPSADPSDYPIRAAAQHAGSGA